MWTGFFLSPAQLTAVGAILAGVGAFLSGLAAIRLARRGVKRDDT